MPESTPEIHLDLRVKRRRSRKGFSLRRKMFYATLLLCAAIIVAVPYLRRDPVQPPIPPTANPFQEGLALNEAHIEIVDGERRMVGTVENRLERTASNVVIRLKLLNSYGPNGATEVRIPEIAAGSKLRFQSTPIAPDIWRYSLAGLQESK